MNSELPTIRIAPPGSGLVVEAQMIWSGPGKRVRIYVNGKLKGEGRWNGSAVRGCEVRLGRSEQQSFALWQSINHELALSQGANDMKQK
jgi:hypothetical protein